MPLWFVEGMAEYLSLGPVAPLTAMWMRDAIQDTVKDSLPSYRQLEDPELLPLPVRTGPLGVRRRYLRGRQDW